MDKERKKSDLTHPSLQSLLEKVPSKFNLVLIAARRAKQMKMERDLINPHGDSSANFLAEALWEIKEGNLPTDELKYVLSSDEDLEPQAETIGSAVTGEEAAHEEEEEEEE
jgi:DNA-directed RNA polymerase omega subunit